MVLSPVAARVGLAVVLTMIVSRSTQDRTEYYSVTGTSIAELRRSLNRLGPVAPDGRRGDAVTLWHVRWRYGTASGGEGCTLSTFDVSLQTVTRMPQWEDESRAPADIAARWREYSRALGAHEEGHRAIAMAAAARVLSAMTQLTPEPSCDRLQRSVARTAELILDEYRRRNRDYDERTDHGRTQGARFP